jgi:pimeloyl-ACP methyl ester carboxylesterase
VAAIPAFKSPEKHAITDEVRNAEFGSYVQLEEGKVRYDLVGSDTTETIVLVHGFSVPSYVWGPTFNAISDAGFRVLRFDMFGRGLSDRPRVRYDRDFYVHHVGELLDSLRITQPVTLVGLSMGGAVVAAFAAEHPERVNDVVLIDPTTQPRDIGIFKYPIIGGWVANTFWMPEAAERQLDDFYDHERFYCPVWSIPHSWISSPGRFIPVQVFTAESAENAEAFPCPGNYGRR